MAKLSKQQLEYLLQKAPKDQDRQALVQELNRRGYQTDENIAQPASSSSASSEPSKVLTRQRYNELLNNAPPEIDRKEIEAEIRRRGYTVGGESADQSPSADKPWWEQVGEGIGGVGKVMGELGTATVREGARQALNIGGFIADNNPIAPLRLVNPKASNDMNQFVSGANKVFDETKAGFALDDRADLTPRPVQDVVGGIAGGILLGGGGAGLLKGAGNAIGRGTVLGGAFTKAAQIAPNLTPTLSTAGRSLLSRIAIRGGEGALYATAAVAPENRTLENAIFGAAIGGGIEGALSLRDLGTGLKKAGSTLKNKDIVSGKTEEMQIDRLGSKIYQKEDGSKVIIGQNDPVPKGLKYAGTASDAYQNYRQIYSDLGVDGKTAGDKLENIQIALVEKAVQKKAILSSFREKSIPITRIMEDFMDTAKALRKDPGGQDLVDVLAAIQKQKDNLLANLREYIPDIDQRIAQGESLGNIKLPVMDAVDLARNYGEVYSHPVMENAPKAVHKLRASIWQSMRGGLDEITGGATREVDDQIQTLLIAKASVADEVHRIEQSRNSHLIARALGLIGFSSGNAGAATAGALALGDIINKTPTLRYGLGNILQKAGTVLEKIPKRFGTGIEGLVAGLDDFIKKNPEFDEPITQMVVKGMTVEEIAVKLQQVGEDFVSGKAIMPRK